MTRLYFVRAFDSDGNNLDLLMRAIAEEEALGMWMSYFQIDEQDLSHYEVRVGRVPDAPKRGVLHWAWIFP
jgi:hypothetical protein